MSKVINLSLNKSDYVGDFLRKVPHAPQKLLKIGIYKVCRQKVAVQGTAARSTPLQEKTSKMSSFIFDVFFFSRAFCLLFPLSV